MSLPTVTVRGEGLAEGPPDLATLNGVLHASGATAPEVRHTLAAASRLVTDALAPYAAALVEVHSAELHVAPVFRPRTPGRVTGYTGRYASRLVVSDFDALSGLVGVLTGLPQSGVDGPWWSLRPGHPLHREARQQAVADARSRAEDYARAFGASLGELLEISDLDGFHGGGAVRYGMAKGPGEESDFDFEPQRQSVSAQVVLRFSLAGTASPGADAP